MATSRVVNTSFWKDTYIYKLDPTEKLLFIYFLTNPRTSMAGIYEINLPEVQFDTGIALDDIERILEKFGRDKKIHYEKDWIVMTNFIKHQRLNPSIVTGIEKAIDDLPKWLRDKIDVSVDEDKQMSIFMADTPQSGDSVSTVSNSLSEYKENKLKLKEKKSKLTPGGDGQKNELSKTQKRSYAIGMDKEREQKKREEKSRLRIPSKPTPVMDDEATKKFYERRTKTL